MRLRNVETANVLPFGAKVEHSLSDVYSQGKLVAQEVKSKLILNDIKYSEPLLILYPTREQIGFFGELKIEGCLKNVSGDKIGEIHIPKGYTIESGRTHFGSWEEYTVKVIPTEIYIRHTVNGEDRKANVTFFLTDNEVVNPWGTSERSFTGEVKTELKSRVILKFVDNWTARFEKYFHHEVTTIEEVKGSFSASHLVLTLEKNNCSISSVDAVRTLSDLVDKLILYLSFGSRQRTIWTKWITKIGNDLVRYYYRAAIPEKKSAYEEPLVGRSSVQEFLQHCLEYESQQKNLDLFLPIAYLVNADRSGKTIESQFLSLFMSLEALLDLYAESRDKNKHFATDTWKKFYCHMKKAIKDFSYPTDKEEYEKLMIEKLWIFNQPSKKILYSNYCDEMGIDNSDLWPIYGKDPDLSYIRNNLIHGKRLKYGSGFFVANEHLKWTVERCLLAALGWKGNSDVSHGALSKYTASRNWESYYESKNEI